MHADKKLWDAFKKGDERALANIFHTNYPLLHNYGLKISGNENLVEDCLQDFFLYLYEKREQLGEVNYIRAYLFKSFRRRLWRQMKQQNKFVKDVEADGIVISPEEIIIHHDDKNYRSEMLAEMINRLPERQREVIYLRYYNGLSIDEISEVLSITYRGVVNTLYKAFKKLRKDKSLLTILECMALIFSIQATFF